MKYDVEIKWYGSVVLKGRMTAVMLNVNLQHMRNNFAGTTFNMLATALPTLMMLARADDAPYAGEYGDETGHFSYYAIVMKED